MAFSHNSCCPTHILTSSLSPPLPHSALPFTVAQALDAGARLVQSQIETVLSTVEEGIQLWDAEGGLLYANPASADMFGVERAAALGGHWSAWSACCLCRSGLPCRPADFPLAAVLDGREQICQMLLQVRREGESPRWVRFNAHVLRDELSGGCRGAVSSTVDVTALMEQESRLQRQAHFDALTGLPNRVLLADRIDHALAHAKRSGEMLAVCLLDLDGFKAVNDVLGHKAGDQLLQEISQRLLESIRAEDTAARLGGDEFALLIGGLKTSGQCEHVLKRILESVAAVCHVGGQPVRVSASIGVTLFPGDGGDPDQLLRHADQAMYKAKQSGKNRFSIFDPTLESRARANMGLLRKLEKALERGEFKLHYQPKVDCRRGKVVGVEALIRWQHPILGSRSPSEFLPLIEHDDFIITLGEWVIAEALRQQAALLEAGFDLSVSINVSARQLLQGRFEDRLGEQLAKYAPEVGKRLEVEIVENAALEDIHRVSSLIAQYHALGVRFALDDFGTGFSSLVHLKRLSADVLKIDQTFVRDMLVDPGDLAIVQGIIGLAGAFQREVVAEGVESIEHILMLLDLGCDLMQGYGIARPLPEERLIEWLTEFKPDPRWRVAQSGFPSHGDFDLLLMDVSHRHWLERLKNALFGEREAQSLPSLDLPSCRLGAWCADARTRSLHGDKPVFRELDLLHHEVHALALSLVDNVKADSAEQWLVLATLTATHEKLTNCLHQLRIAPNLRGTT